MTVQFQINGIEMRVEDGVTIWEAARRRGIEIPALCHHPSLPSVGSCRLCLVDASTDSAPVCACVTPVDDGMSVSTDTSMIRDERRQILEMLLADFPKDTESDSFNSTEFGRLCRQYDVGQPTWGRVQRRFPVDADPNPFLRVDFNECILCMRCVRACDDVQGRFVWGVSERSRDTHIVAGVGTNMLDARCESCGACADVCPTDALTDRVKFGQPVPDRTVRTVCTYCGVGCQLGLDVRDEQIVSVSSLEDVQPNAGHLCVKGRYGFDFIHHPERVLQPRVRKWLLDDEPHHDANRGEWIDVDWSTALDIVASRLCRIQSENGGDAIGFFSSAKCTNEENYLMQKLARQVFGTNNIDHCARLCHASTVAGLAMSFGSGAMSNSMDDIVEHAQALFVIGSNTTEQHPVFGSQLRQCVLQRNVPLVVADPRRIDLTEFATLHLRQRPGTDAALLNGLMHIVVERGWHDVAFITSRCEDFDAFADSLARYTPEYVAAITGVPVTDLEQAAEIIALNKPMAAVWAMGITQHTTGVMNVLCLANLQMLLGNMGVPGGGVNPLRGQNNVQGACDMGALPNVFPGYQPVTSAECRPKFADAWALNGTLAIPPQPGLTITEMIDAAGCGDVRALYIMGENPVMTDPDSNHVRECLTNAELIVLQEIFPSETSHYADVLLPGTSFAERDGTFTNTDRRVQRVRRAIEPIGDTRPDWRIINQIAERSMSVQKRDPTGPYAGWAYDTPESVMQEIAALTPSYAGVAWHRLERGERLQWPVPDENHPGTPVLHVDRFTRGPGRFHPVDHLPPHELPDADYPLLLTTGRVLHHWHGGEMTRRSAGLASVVAESLLEISPEDARRFCIEDGGVVHASSRRGHMEARALVTDRVPAGVIFGNFHFPGSGNVNNLTIKALDPTAKIPEYKVCAIRLEQRPEHDPLNGASCSAVSHV